MLPLCQPARATLHCQNQRSKFGFKECPFSSPVNHNETTTAGMHAHSPPNSKHLPSRCLPRAKCSPKRAAGSQPLISGLPAASPQWCLRARKPCLLPPAWKSCCIHATLGLLVGRPQPLLFSGSATARARPAPQPAASLGLPRAPCGDPLQQGQRQRAGALSVHRAPLRCTPHLQLPPASQASAQNKERQHDRACTQIRRYPKKE